MATVTRYVNAASSAGGDGTTNATAGANRAYGSINEAFDAAVAGKSTSDTWDVYCEGTTADSVQLLIDNAANTTSSQPLRFIATGANRHAGTWSTGAFRFERNHTTFGQGMIQASVTAYVDFIGLQINNTGAHSNAVSVLRISNAAFAGRLRFFGCIVRQSGTGTPDGALVRINSTAAYELWMVNCLCYDGRYWIWQEDFTTASVKVLLYNNTVRDLAIGTGNGLFLQDLAGGNTYVKNNYIHVASGSGLAYDGPGNTVAQATNATSDASSPTVALRSVTPTFVNAAGDDFHLDAADTALKGQGTDLSTDASGQYSFTDDIDLGTRSGTWDVGADEYSSGIVTGVVGPRQAGQLARANAIARASRW